MKTKYILFALLMLAFASPLFSQSDEGDFESVKIAFLTRKLSLTPNEAKVFWPVYDACQAEMKQVKSGMKGDFTASRSDFAGLSDAEVEEVVDRYMNYKKQEADIAQKYHAEFKKVLPIRKVAHLYKAEKEFTRMLLRRLQDRNGGGNGNMRNRRR